MRQGRYKHDVPIGTAAEIAYNASIDEADAPVRMEIINDRPIPFYLVPSPDGTPVAPAPPPKSDATDVPNKPARKQRKSTHDRIKKIYATIRTYWKRIANGENVTQRQVATDDGWKEDILSKATAKPVMNKINAMWCQIQEMKARKNETIGDNDRASFLAYVSDCTKS